MNRLDIVELSKLISRIGGPAQQHQLSNLNINQPDLNQLVQ